MSDHTPFLKMLPFCNGMSAFCGGLEKAEVTKVCVSRVNRSMELSVRFAAMPSMAESDMLCSAIKDQYGLDSVTLQPDYPMPEPALSPDNEEKREGAGTVIFGKRMKRKTTLMKELGRESGKVAVEGDVFNVESRPIAKGGAVMKFDMTDRTGSVKISRFLKSDDDCKAIDNIKNGDHLLVYGEMVDNRYDGLVLEPRGIVKLKKQDNTRPDNAEVKRVELHAHTRFSAMDALTNPADLVKRAAFWGMSAIAVTDHGVAQAFPDMWKAGKKYGIKIIYGIEAYYVDDREGDVYGFNLPDGTKRPRVRSNHMVLLAKNRTGLKNMYKLISESYLTYFRRTPTVPRTLLEKHRDGLIIGSACSMGELYDAVINRASDDELEKIASFYDYLEIQPLCNNAYLVEEGNVGSLDDVKAFNRRVYDLGKKLGKPVVAASDIHFLDSEDEQLRRIILYSKNFDDADREMPLFFRNTEEMLKEFEYLGKDTAKEIVITNPVAIADSVEPLELLPKELFPPRIENSADQLKDLVYTKMHRIYGENPPKIVQERVDTELNTILDHNYDVIYMSAQKLVQNSLEHGYLVGSRGSVGSSLVAYMSGITEVNSLPPHYVCPKCCHSEFVTDGSYGCGADMPEKNCPDCGTEMRRDGFDIPFETFLGFPGNEKTPDIDLNFSGEYQAQAHKYTEVLFGSDHVFRAGTIGTLAEKTAYGYVLKYLEGHNMEVSKAEESRLAGGLVGIKRTTGQHPGGLVIVPRDKDITDFCPVQHPADDPDSDIITTHFEYHCMEDNLLKLDELGHDDPTMIRMMEDMTGIDAKQILLSDPDTMSIFTSPAVLGLPEDDPIIGKTGTIGVPEFGTGFTRQMLVDTQPKHFNTLVRLSGFSHGTDVWAGNIQDLIASGTATVDETVGCRDDIMIYLISKGMEASRAFKFMEAVRKGAIHKGKNWPDNIVEDMQSLGVPEWWIESCRKIQYLFPKAHAVAYVMMAFRIAWFKVHRPIAFYSAYFYRRSQKGNFDAALMTGGTDAVRRKINEFKRKNEMSRDGLSKNEEEQLVTMEAVYEFNMRGFSFAGIDLYESDATHFKIVDENTLRPPFVSIAGLGEAAAFDLEACGKSGEKFVSVEEVGSACPKVSQAHLEALRSLGALGDMPDTSQITLFDF